MTRRRVVITGLGIVAPHGNNVASIFSELLEGRSAVRSIEVSSAAGKLNFVGAAIPEEPWRDMSGPSVATSDKISLYALTAADSAIRDAHLELEHEDLS